MQLVILLNFLEPFGSNLRLELVPLLDFADVILLVADKL